MYFSKNVDVKDIEYQGTFWHTCFDGYTRECKIYICSRTGEIIYYWIPDELLGRNSSYKIGKGDIDNYILYLRPANGNIFSINLCRDATKACTLACLGNTSGHMKRDKVQAYQHNKTLFYILDPSGFKEKLSKDINKAIRRYQRTGIPFAIRLNGTSDISWVSIIKAFPNVQFYDYTKSVKRANTNKFSNYHLTLSHSGYNKLECISYLDNGGNVAAVVLGERPKTLWGFPTINADKDDNRFFDPPGHVSVLSIKGRQSKELLKDPFFIKV